MASHPGKPRGIRDVQVDPTSQPGWVSGLQRLPACGEQVETSEGAATVIAILGKTGGGRLLHLAMDDGRKHPFFAAQANVLVRPVPVGGAQP
jgi:hypothetical protein